MFYFIITPTDRNFLQRHDEVAANARDVDPKRDLMDVGVARKSRVTYDISTPVTHRDCSEVPEV